MMFRFYNQYTRVVQAMADIEPLFRDHIITKLSPDGSFMEHEEIFSRIMRL